MKYSIRQKGEKYFKKLKPSGYEIIVGLIVAFSVIYIIFQLLRG